MTQFKYFKHGFSMVEILVALAVLSVGLLGMTMMTVMAVRGSGSAQLHASATDLCKNRMVQLKDVYWESLGEAIASDPLEDQREFGLTGGQIFTQSNINELGNTWAEQFAIESSQLGNVCEGVGLPLQSGGSGECYNRLDSLGPYAFTFGSVICKGEDYTNAGAPLPGTSEILASIPGAAKPTKEPDCAYSPSDAKRPKALTCQSSDIAAPAGTDAADKEKVIKVLCSWRDKNAACGSVESSSTEIDLSL